MKELYLHRAVEVQPCFNREVLRDLSDRATTTRLELEAWAEGENIQFDVSRPADRVVTAQQFGTDEDELDVQILQSAATGNLQSLGEWIAKLQSFPDAADRTTRMFLTAINEFSDDVLGLLLTSGLVDIHAEDDINERNCLHEAAISGRDFVLKAGIAAGVNVSRADVYGRIPLHYACMHGRVEMVRELLAAGPLTVDQTDHDNFAPLIHSIVKDQVACAKELLYRNARIDPVSESDHIPLNLACQHGSLPIIEMLLERNAQLLPDAEGLYPQHMVARASQSPQLLLLLKNHGADLNQRDKMYQWTPLFHAASEGCVDCLRTLLELGVDADVVDEKGQTAMYYAAWEGHLECMLLLWSRSPDANLAQKPLDVLNGLNLQENSSAVDQMATEAAEPSKIETADGIPDLSLPPPIIPLRRYGHNFLDKRAFVQIMLDQDGFGSVIFDQTGRHPAARLTISSKHSDLIPRTIMLPIQEDSRIISFQVDNLDTFTVDFEIYPTFGSKVIAKTMALPTVFEAERSSTGTCTLPLFDPRLRSIGELRFRFQVIKPYHGDPLEITHFATYWKATTTLDSEHNGLITGSSLSGDYVQLFVQLTSDGVPVSYPQFTINHHGIEIPICQLTHAQFQTIGVERTMDRSDITQFLQTQGADALPKTHCVLASSFFSLREVLQQLPVGVNVNLSILYPSTAEQQRLSMASLADVNSFADAILTVVFEHARETRDRNPDFMRSIVFTSYNTSVCVALNWKQPNCKCEVAGPVDVLLTLHLDPILLCNDLGQVRDLARGADSLARIHSSGRASMSIKESARIGQGNNFMGLICRSRLLVCTLESSGAFVLLMQMVLQNVVPALVDTIKGLGLVLVADTTDETRQPAQDDSAAACAMGAAAEWAYRMPNGVNGVMRANGILRFNDTIDM